MPKLTVEGVGTFDVPEGKRLVLALEDDAKIDQLHACGGNARCTTCRVEFLAGEPEQMTVAEKTVPSGLRTAGPISKTFRSVSVLIVLPALAHVPV